MKGEERRREEEEEEDGGDQASQGMETTLSMETEPKYGCLPLVWNYLDF